MDTDFWAARVHSQSTMLTNSGNHMLIEGEGGGDEVGAWFPCPFCYVEIELPLLCIHLQQEHCFDLKNAVCPICAANLGKDALGHFMVQHAHSIKRRKKSQKSGFWSNVPTNFVKDLRELSSFLGNNSITGPGNLNESGHDPLLSPFLCTVPATAPKDSRKEISSSFAATRDAESKTDCPDKVEGEDYEERKKQVAFVQELLFSTIF
ncbi:hypothetical protein ABFS83_09G013600 [Erythranthe nasuta]